VHACAPLPIFKFNQLVDYQYWNIKTDKIRKKTRENKEDYYNTVMRECGTFPASLKQPWPGAVPDS